MNISGDPTLRVTTPGVAIDAIDFNPPAGVPFNVLTDPDNNFVMNATLHAINPEGNKAIAQVDLNVNGHHVQFANDGNLLIDGQPVGNIQNGVNPIDLGNGNTIRATLANDGNGQQAIRFVLTTPEYEVTAALRKPTGALPYYDVNVAERTAGSADNAVGNNINGQPFSVADLLRQEPS